MTPKEFRNTLTGAAPPSGLTPQLEALWWDAKGDWSRAHEIAQEIADRSGSRIHAYLHRKEGDQGNAQYWYDRSGESLYEGSLESEWEDLVRRFL
jgi:hypothetical protein